MKQIIAAGLLLAACAAGAQPVYRCGSSYSQQPCPGGSAVDTLPNGTTSQDAARARAVALGDAKRADAMEKARLEQEKNAPKALVIGPQTAASAPVAKEAAKKKPGRDKKPEHFTAAIPATGKAKK
jgi:hypothetical protein